MAFNRVIFSDGRGTKSTGQNNVEEKPTVLLYAYTDRHAGTPKAETKNDESEYSSILLR